MPTVVTLTNGRFTQISGHLDCETDIAEEENQYGSIPCIEFSIAEPEPAPLSEGAKKGCEVSAPDRLPGKAIGTMNERLAGAAAVRKTTSLTSHCDVPTTWSLVVIQADASVRFGHRPDRHDPTKSGHSSVNRID